MVDADFLKQSLAISDIRKAEVLNASADRGRTPLHTCAGNVGRSAHGQLLIDAGADVNVLLAEGYSVLDIASQTLNKLEAMISQEVRKSVLSATPPFYRDLPPSNP